MVIRCDIKSFIAGFALLVTFFLLANSIASRSDWRSVALANSHNKLTPTIVSPLVVIPAAVSAQQRENGTVIEHLVDGAIEQATEAKGAAEKTAASPESQNAASSRRVSLAVCVSGGLRNAPKCAPSQLEALFRRAQPTTMVTYLATWSDYDIQCFKSKRGRLEHNVRDLYKDFNLSGAVFMNQRDVDMAPLHYLWRKWPNCSLPAGSEGSPKEPDAGRVCRYFENMYHQWAIWSRCMGMVGESDVVVKIRPDMYFRSNSSFNWNQRDTATGVPVIIFQGKRYAASDNSVYVLESQLHRGFVDDTLVFGSRRAMVRALEKFKTNIDDGKLQMSDTQYRTLRDSPPAEPPDRREGHEAKFPIEAPWRAWPPERTFLHHMKLEGLNIVFVGKRNDVLENLRSTCGQGTCRSPPAAS